MRHQRVQDIIRQVLLQNRFKAAVLTDASGLPLVALPDGPEAEAPAAMVAIVRRAFDQVHERVGLGAMEEMILRDEAGQKLVCRRIVADQHDMVLAILVPPNIDHRRAIDDTVKKIKQAWWIKSAIKG